MADTIISDPMIRSLLELLGYSSLYPPQEEAISKEVLDGKNLLVTTPTASGKTLIAMMAAAKTIEKGQKCVYLTPLRALASEKYHDFQVMEKLDLDGKKIKVMVATGDYDSAGKELAWADVIVLTNEKMDTLIRHGAEWLSEVGLFVADEVHLIGDRDRGPTLEMMLTLIRRSYSNAQLLALSATVSNSDEIADWLGCDLVESNWRPTKLVEGVYDYGTVRMNDRSVIKIKQSGLSVPVDIAVDSLDSGGQALIFAETRKRASSLAAKAANAVYSKLDKEAKELAAKAASEITKRSEDTELTSTLAQLVSKGVAFHHAGLGSASREIVEDSFKKGIIKLLSATPTLAAGVNLPARRVVIASTLRYDSERGNVRISILEYKQLCGRAGRPMYDTKGEAIIVSGESGFGPNAEQLYDHYVLGSPEDLRSQLSNEKALRFHLLSVIATAPGMKKSEIQDFFKSTLFARQNREAMVTFKIDSAFDYLEEEKLVMPKGERYIATEFGKKVSLLYIDPVTAVEFKKAIESIERRPSKSDSNHSLGFLHLISNSPDFYPKLALRRKDIEDLSLVIQTKQNELFYEISEYDCSRSLLAMNEWINESTDRNLDERLGVEPGDMHRMKETGDWLAFALYEVAKLLRREDLLVELYKLRTRIRYGVKEELLSLISLEGIGRVRARALYEAGLTSPASVAKAPLSILSEIPKIGPAVAKKLKEQLKGTTGRVKQ